ncbi:MAG: hypothetical protein KKA73_15710 [Chloroflexi bacterium]|nr:hypothetical protein [Chloroflexota bacterium]MBU1749130.1 hypothetical protein [Chloroflexota bacterium]MBU1879549.1 hypothetical protein [Chloroflexota bacterium]
MSKDRAKKRQKSLERKQAKRKQAQARQRSSQPTGFRGQLQAAARWSLMECLVSREWQNTRQLTQVVVARRSTAGRIAVSVFLVDLACLGVKNAFAKLFNNSTEYRQLRDHIMERQELVPTDLDLAAKIIREGLAYANDLGFEPHPDYYEALPLLGDANADACDTPIPVGGEEGMPFFMAGPYDDVDEIMAHLNQTVGPGNFHFLFPLGSPPPAFFE